jgi:predicted nucleotidyltransferase
MQQHAATADSARWGQALARAPLTARLAHAAPVLRYIVEKAVRELAPQRIVLFGSRARGDHGSRADLDLAFELDSPKHFGAFCAAVREDAPTLLEMDLVDLATATEALRSAVRREGIVLYERA